MTDNDDLAALNDRFIDACQKGSWAMLEPILSQRFGYVDGTTGRLWSQPAYVEDLEGKPSPHLTIDQVEIRVMADVGIVTARTSNGTGRHNRYLDVYAKETHGWRCVHATVWATDPEPTSPQT